MQSSDDNNTPRPTSHISCTPKQGQQVPKIAIRLTLSAYDYSYINMTASAYGCNTINMTASIFD